LLDRPRGASSGKLRSARIEAVPRIIGGVEHSAGKTKCRQTLSVDRGLPANPRFSRSEHHFCRDPLVAMPVRAAIDLDGRRIEWLEPIGNFAQPVRIASRPDSRYCESSGTRRGAIRTSVARHWQSPKRPRPRSPRMFDRHPASGLLCAGKW